jgi:hypothetical protein
VDCREWDTFNQQVPNHQGQDGINNDLFLQFREVLQHFSGHYNELIEFIKANGTPACKLKHNRFNRFILSMLGFKQGFIAPQPGNKRYQWLCKWLMTQQSSSFYDTTTLAALNQHGLFLFTEPTLTTPWLTYQMHHWTSFLSGCNGYSQEALSLFERFSKKPAILLDETLMESLSGDQIRSLKESIKREMEALIFLKTITDEVLLPAQHGRQVIRKRSVAS